MYSILYLINFQNFFPAILEKALIFYFVAIICSLIISLAELSCIGFVYYKLLFIKLHYKQSYITWVKINLKKITIEYKIILLTFGVFNIYCLWYFVFINMSPVLILAYIVMLYIPIFDIRVALIYHALNEPDVELYFNSLHYSSWTEFFISYCTPFCYSDLVFTQGLYNNIFHWFEMVFWKAIKYILFKLIAVLFFNDSKFIVKNFSFWRAFILLTTILFIPVIKPFLNIIKYYYYQFFNKKTSLSVIAATLHKIVAAGTFRLKPPVNSAFLKGKAVCFLADLPDLEHPHRIIHATGQMWGLGLTRGWFLEPNGCWIRFKPPSWGNHPILSVLAYNEFTLYYVKDVSKYRVLHKYKLNGVTDNLWSLLGHNFYNYWVYQYQNKKGASNNK